MLLEELALLLELLLCLGTASAGLPSGTPHVQDVKAEHVLSWVQSEFSTIQLTTSGYRRSKMAGPR